MKFSIVYKFSLTIILLVVMSTGLVGWVFYTKSSDLLISEALNDISVKINNAGLYLTENIQRQKEDILFLADLPPIQGMLRSDNKNKYDDKDKSSYQQWLSRQALIFSQMMRVKPDYEAIRFIDLLGNEKLVVKRDGDKIVRVKDSKLQNKSKRKYFINTIKLRNDSVYVSEINLNREYGKISQPHREVIRCSTPIYNNQTGEVAGVLLITAEIGHQLRAIQKVGQLAESQIYITNDKGGYLLHHDRSKVYGFDLGKHFRIQEEFPQLAPLYLPENSDSKIILKPEGDDDKHVINFTKIKIDPAQPDRFIAVGITKRYDSIIEKQSGVLTNVVVVALGLMLLAAVVAFVFAYRMTKPIKQITQAVDDYAHQRASSVDMPVHYKDEIGVLARSYESMIEQVEEAQRNLESLNNNLEAKIEERTFDLEVSERKQRAVLENMVDGLVTIDTKGLIQSFNSAAVKLFGYEEREVIGHNVKLLMPEPYQSDHDGYLEHYNQTGTKKIIGIGREVEGRRKDGSVFPLELSVAELLVNDQKIFTGVVRDITERKHAEQEINSFKKTLDETMDCVFMFEPDSLKFFYVNAGAMKQVGYSSEEMMTKKAFDIKPEFDEERFRKTIAPMIAGEQPVINFETLHEHKDGHTIPVEIFLQYVSPPGESPRFVAIVRDITERKQIDKIKNEFISTVSHELRTPLTSIRGSLGLLSSGSVGELPGSAREMLKIASNNTERLLLLINDILDIQKIESGQIALNFQKLAVMPFLKQALEDNAAYGQQHGVKFKIDKSLDDAQVYADKDRLMQVMANLLSNAAKFSPVNDTVEISVARHKGSIRVAVTDHGKGIPEEFQPKLFEKFTQSDSSDTRQKGGTGLGLSITKAILESHGGRIDFVSKEGIGTTFYFELPELVGDLKNSGNLLRNLSNEEHQACILIIEDNEDVAALIKRMLAESGYNADIAYSVEEARKLLSVDNCRYSLITLDLILPGEDGLSFMNELRANKETQDIPIVVVSAKADDAKKTLVGGTMGVVDWINKPIDEERLIHSIKQVTSVSELPRVLHVEDETDVHNVVKSMLSEYCEMESATTLAEAKDILNIESFDLVLLDIGLPDGSGLDLLPIIEQHPDSPQVVIFSAYDVASQYAEQVSEVLVKSKTNNFTLAEVVNKLLK